MSTEQQPSATTPTHQTNPAHNQPKPEPNALAQSLSSGWEKFKSGQLISYKWMAVILVAVAAIGTTWWIVHERNKAKSALWVELDGLSSPTGLEEFAKKNPGTIQGRLATLEAARMQLEPEGIDRLASERPEVRKTAIENVEKARDTFAKLVDEFKNDPVIRVECLLSCAKAEAVLVGIPKEGKQTDLVDPLKPLSPTDFRGDPAKAIEWLDKVAEAAPDTDWGKDSKKLADALRNQNTQQQVRMLQMSVLDASRQRAGMGGGAGFPGHAGLQQ